MVRELLSRQVGMHSSALTTGRHATRLCVSPYQFDLPACMQAAARNAIAMERLLSPSLEELDRATQSTTVDNDQGNMSSANMYANLPVLSRY